MLEEANYTLRPDRILMIMQTGDIGMHEDMADYAVQMAKDIMPKISGSLSMTLRPAYGETFWGIYFPDRRAWYLEKGTNPFTMKSLAGKTIPMWVDDPDGSIAKEQGRKAKRRVTVDGRKQTLIFRKAARQGERKTIMRNGRRVDVPKSYPGAPGRISNRLSNGRIGSPNVGVRWRHPGITGRHYLNNAMELTALSFAIEPGPVSLVDAATFATATRS